MEETVSDLKEKIMCQGTSFLVVYLWQRFLIPHKVLLDWFDMAVSKMHLGPMTLLYNTRGAFTE